MRRPLRLALGIVGLAAAVHGVASLTGGWLGTPPWWEHEVEKFVSPPEAEHRHWRWRKDAAIADEPAPGRWWISGGVTAAGLGLLAWAAWPRSRPDAATSG